MKHDVIEKNVGLMIVLTLVALSFGTLVELVPLMFAKETNEPIVKAVITVPALFNEQQREATREAGELAGLEVVRIINEPTAASLTYPSDQEKGEHLVVYDLGGGTFDVSSVQIEQEVVEVLSSHGNTQLGGDDFDWRHVPPATHHVRQGAHVQRRAD